MGASLVQRSIPLAQRRQILAARAAVGEMLPAAQVLAARPSWAAVEVEVVAVVLLLPMGQAARAVNRAQRNLMQPLLVSRGATPL
jgi:hypothetical protein